MGCGTGKLKILAINGSLKKDSNHAGLIRFLQGLQLQHQIEVLRIDNLPIYNEDLEKQNKIPSSVRDLRSKIQHADAIIFASPEYNGGVSGALKNAFDWASRGEKTGFGEASPLTGKKAGLISASYVSQNQLKDIRRMGTFNNIQFHGTDFYIKLGAGAFFDAHGNLTNEDEKKKLTTWAQEFGKFVATRP